MDHKPGNSSQSGDESPLHHRPANGQGVSGDYSVVARIGRTLGITTAVKGVQTQTQLDVINVMDSTGPRLSVRRLHSSLKPFEFLEAN